MIKQKKWKELSADYIAVVDFGSYLTRLLVIKRNDQRVLVHACERSEGISHGVIVDLEKASLMLKRLFDQIKGKLDHRLSEVYCSISGDSIASQGSHGVVKIRHQEVSRYDMDDLFATAEAITLDNQKVIHLLPKQYKVDNQKGVMDPVGMYGVRLEGDFHLVLVDLGVLQNISRAFSRVGVQIAGFIFMPLGLADISLHHDEKQQGVVLVDIGEGTTDFVVYHDGMVQFSGSIPLGGGAVTRDIAHKLKVDNSVAEKLKLAVVNASGENVLFSEGVSISEIHEVISARYIQIMRLLEQSIVKEGLKRSIDRGYVLCGGAAQYPGLSIIIEDVFGQSCRMGGLIEREIELMSPSWLGAVGLVHFARKMKETTGSSRNSACRRAFKMLQRWLEVYF